MGVEVMHGILRTVLLAPRVADFRARHISVFTGSLLILCIAYLFVGWISAQKTSSLISVGLVWLGLTLIFELGAGHYLPGRTWQDLASDYNILHGELLPVGLAVLTFSPLLAARWRGLSQLTGSAPE
jgi:hypothetical protein